MEKKCIRDLHVGHFGIVRSKIRAKSTIWWPNITKQIEDAINNCEICLKHTKPGTEPMLSLECPSLPWKTIGADLFEIEGKNYLAVQDYYSRFPEFVELSDIKSKTVIKHLKDIFARFGTPKTVRSDNGRQQMPTILSGLPAVPNTRSPTALQKVRSNYSRKY